MTTDSSFHDYIVYDLLEGVPGVRSRRMFGSWGLYQDDKFFAIIDDGELYFKTGETKKAELKKLGSHPFTYTKEGKQAMLKNYWLVPAEILEDREQFLLWLNRAVAA